MNELGAQGRGPAWSYNLTVIRTWVTFKAVRVDEIQGGRKKSEGTRDRAREPTTSLCQGRCCRKAQEREEGAEKGGNQEAWCPRAQAKKEEGGKNHAKSC